MNNYRIESKILQNTGTSKKKIENLTGYDSNMEDGNRYEFIETGKKVINFSIEAQPGLEFYINNNQNPIIIGPNGLFSWEIKNLNFYIYSIQIIKTTEVKPKTNIIITYEYLNE